MKPKLLVVKTSEDSDSDNDDTNTTSEIVADDNNIYFYCPVTIKNILDLTVNIKKVTKKLQILGITFGNTPPEINLYINSGGGDVHAALSVLDLINTNPIPINTIITGMAASAATLISIMGHKRYISSNSYMLIHNMSSSFWGKMHELQDEMKNMAKVTQHLKNIYLTNSNIKSKQLEALLKQDLLLEPDVALKHGFVDEINLV